LLIQAVIKLLKHQDSVMAKFLYMKAKFGLQFKKMLNLSIMYLS